MSESPTPIVVGEAKQDDTKRVKVLAGIGIALLLLVLVVPRVFGGAGDDGSGTGTEPLADGVVTTTTTVPSGEGAGSSGGGSSHDPFKPLSTAGQNPPAAVPASEGGSDTSFDDVVSGGTGAGGTNTGDTGTGSGGSGGSPTVTISGVRFTLLEVLDGPSARVRVDDQVFDGLHVDDTFGGSYRVSSLDTTFRCGTFVYGDRRIALCEGEEAIV
ncbi:MAG: hypothetical protein AB7H43_06310 [Acidimicrobiia bacterium]